MTPEQEENYSGLVRSIVRQNESASEVSQALTEYIDRLRDAKFQIITAHIDIDKLEGKIVPYSSGHGST